MRPSTFLEDGVLHCTCADGELVTVLVEHGEPRIDAHATDARLLRVVRSDGTIIVDDVVSVRLGGSVQRRARVRAIVGWTWDGRPIFRGSIASAIVRAGWYGGPGP